MSILQKRILINPAESESRFKLKWTIANNALAGVSTACRFTKTINHSMLSLHSYIAFEIAACTVCTSKIWIRSKQKLTRTPGDHIYRCIRLHEMLCEEQQSINRQQNTRSKQHKTSNSCIYIPVIVNTKQTKCFGARRSSQVNEIKLKLIWRLVS